MFRAEGVVEYTQNLLLGIGEVAKHNTEALFGVDVMLCFGPFSGSADFTVLTLIGSQDGIGLCCTGFMITNLYRGGVNNIAMQCW